MIIIVIFFFYRLEDFSLEMDLTNKLWKKVQSLKEKYMKEKVRVFLACYFEVKFSLLTASVFYNFLEPK